MDDVSSGATSPLAAKHSNIKSQRMTPRLTGRTHPHDVAILVVFIADCAGAVRATPLSKYSINHLRFLCVNFLGNVTQYALHHSHFLQAFQRVLLDRTQGAGHNHPISGTYERLTSITQVHLQLTEH